MRLKKSCQGRKGSSRTGKLGRLAGGWGGRRKMTAAPVPHSNPTKSSGSRAGLACPGARERRGNPSARLAQASSSLSACGASRGGGGGGGARWHPRTRANGQQASSGYSRHTFLPLLVPGTGKGGAAGERRKETSWRWRALLEAELRRAKSARRRRLALLGPSAEHPGVLPSFFLNLAMSSDAGTTTASRGVGGFASLSSLPLPLHFLGCANKGLSRRLNSGSLPLRGCAPT